MSRTCKSLAGMLLIGLVLPLGCSSRNSSSKMIAKANRSRLQRLANLYAMHQATHAWQGPANEEEFRTFIQATDAELLTEMGVDLDQLDKLFVSERDECAFKIRYGIPGGIGSSEPVIFESEGKRGYREVGFTAMRQEMADAERYEQLWSQAGADRSPQENPQAAPDGRSTPPRENSGLGE